MFVLITSCKNTNIYFPGDGIDEPILLGQDGCLNVDTSKAGKGRLHGKIEAPSGEMLDCEVTENPDGDCQIFFTPKECGDHKASVYFGGEELPGSPFIIHVCCISSN